MSSSLERYLRGLDAEELRFPSLERGTWSWVTGDKHTRYGGRFRLKIRYVNGYHSLALVVNGEEFRIAETRPLGNGQPNLQVAIDGLRSSI